MSISVVQSLDVTSIAASSSLTTNAFGSATTTGNTIIVFVWMFAGAPAVSSITDSTGSNTYTKSKSSTNVTTGCEIWISSNITGGSSFTLTVNTGAGTYITASAIEVSGLTNSSPADGTGAAAGNINSVANPAPGNFSTTNANDLIVATFADSSLTQATDPSGYTRISHLFDGGTNEDGVAVYQIVAATQTNINPTWTSVDNNAGKWDAIGYAYQAAASTFPGGDDEGITYTVITRW